MAKLTVQGDELVVGLSAPEKVTALHGDVRVPLAAVHGVAVQPHPWRAMRGLRVGTSLPGVLFYGTRRHPEGKDFGAVRAGREAVQVDLDERSPFARLLVSVADAEGTAEAIRAAAGL